MTINLVSGAQRHVYRCALCDSTTHIGSRAPTPRTFDGLRAWTGEHPLKAGALLAAWFVATFVGLGLALRWAALWRVSQW